MAKMKPGSDIEVITHWLRENGIIFWRDYCLYRPICGLYPFEYE